MHSLLEKLSLELKEYLRQYDTAFLLGQLTQTSSMIANGMAHKEIEKLSSPQRQMYYVAGLMMSAEPYEETRRNFTEEEWNFIVDKINAIEIEYYNLFWPKEDKMVDAEWKKKRLVVMPSFLSYFNLGTLNYEEQVICWIRDLYTQEDSKIERTFGLKTEDFLNFYESMDAWCQHNLQMLSQTTDIPLSPNWKDYVRMDWSKNDGIPEELRAYGEEAMPTIALVVDGGLKNRFYPTDLVTDELSIEKVNAILQLLTCKRENRDFLYYTSMNPGNPLYEKPIVDIGKGIYQVYEEKQVLHAIDALLEKACCQTQTDTSKFVHKKGEQLENRIVGLFDKFFKKRATIYKRYYVDGCEQDILVLYRDMALVIEAKAYSMREPLRDPERAYPRIKDDFNKSIGYANEQLWRVEQKFIEQKPLVLTDKDGNQIAEIDTTKYKDGDFYIIVNQKSFGQIQMDLSMLLELPEGAHYPWAIKCDDLEVFLLTLMRRKKDWLYLKRFLFNREFLHERVIGTDELEICGGYLTGDLTDEMMQGEDMIYCTPSLADVFDLQYHKGIGFKDEKHWVHKKAGDTLFL